MWLFVVFWSLPSFSGATRRLRGDLMTVSDSVDDGRVELLRALLRDITERYDEAEYPRDAKALAVEIREISAELDELDPQEVEKPRTPLGDLLARREARKKTA